MSTHIEFMQVIGLNDYEKLKLRTKIEFYTTIGKYLELGFNEIKAIEQTEKDLIKLVCQR